MYFVQIVGAIALVAACTAKKAPKQQVARDIVERGPGSLEVTESGMYPTEALTLLLKLRDSTNAAAFEPAIQFLINVVCDSPGDVPVDIANFYPMERINDLHSAGCGNFYLNDGSTVCGQKSQLSGKCTNTQVPPR